MIFTKSWEELGVLIDGGAKTVKHKLKKQKTVEFLELY